MEHLYLSTVVIGGILVNCGVMTLLDILEVRSLAVVTLALGAGLLGATVIAPSAPVEEAADGSARSVGPVEIRTPIIDGVTVRVGPGPSYERARAIWQVNRGERLRVVEDTLGWIRFHIKHFNPDWSGWVAADYTTVWETYEEIKRIDRIIGRRGRPARGD